MKIKVGITGASGVLGKYITADNLQFEWYPFSGDITKLDSIMNWASTLPQLDAIIHLAAIVAVSRADASPNYAREVNVGGVENLISGLNAANRLKNTWFFFPSSAHVYKSSNNSIQETDEVQPISFYGKTKLEAEIAIQQFSDIFHFPYCIGRIFSYTSPLQSNDFVIPSLYEKVKHAPLHSKLEIRGANNVRDFLTAEKVSNIIKQLTVCKESGIINIGSGNMFSIHEIAEEVRNQLNRSDLTFDLDNQSPSKLIADISKLRNLSCNHTLTLSELVSHFIKGREVIA